MKSVRVSFSLSLKIFDANSTRAKLPSSKAEFARIKSASSVRLKFVFASAANMRAGNPIFNA